jgi:Tol biopolymer transport system component
MPYPRLSLLSIAGLIIAVIISVGFVFLVRQSNKPIPQIPRDGQPSENEELEIPEFEVRRLFEAGGQYGVSEIAWSPDGTMLAYTLEGGGGHGPSSYIYSFVSPDQWVFPPNTSSYSISWSPDGKTLAYASPDGGEIVGGQIEDGKPVLKPGIWIMNADGSNTRRITSPHTIAGSPSWDSNGEQVVFAMGNSLNNPSDPFQIWTMDKDGSNQKQLTSDSLSKGAPQFSPDGEMILFLAPESELPHTSSAVYDLWVMNIDDTGQKILYQTVYPRSIENPLWSPDGAKILFYSGYIWLVDKDGSNLAQIAQGTEPSWNSDGTKIAYLDGGIWIMDSDGKNKAQLVERLERGPLVLLC